MSDRFSTKVVDENPRHTRIRVFNQGALAGTLTVLTEDAQELIERINGKTERTDNVT